MSKPKIFVFTTSYYPFIGGAEIAIQEVAKRLAREFDFFIVTSRFRRSLPRREIRPEGTVVRLGFGTRFDKWLLPFLSLSRLSLDSDYRGLASIAWGIDIGQGALAAMAVKCIFPRIPFILTLQYGESAERLEKGRWGLNRLGFRVLLQSADYVTAISTYLLDLARRFDYCGPAEVIHNGVDIDKFKIRNPKFKTTKQNPKCIITVSRLVPKNGVDILIKAIAEVKKTIPDVQLRIIGDGPERTSYRLLVTSYQLEDNISFLGEIPHEEVPAYLHDADIFVRPSRSEGMGNAFVEALAAGLPTIGTPVGGITDIIEDGKTGLFARVEDPHDLAEKIIRLLHNPTLAEHIAINGHQMVSERFSWDKIAETYRNIFVPSLAWYKNVVIATGLFPPEIGGPATYSKLLVDELPQRGVGIRVVPFRLVRRLPKILRHIAYFRRLIWASRGSDIIFAQDPVSVGMPALIASKILRKKFILKIVGDYAWEQGVGRFGVRETLDGFQIRRYGWRVELLRWMEAAVARRARKIVVPSDYLKEVVVRWGIAPEKVAVVYNAFSALTASQSKSEARRKLGIPPDTFVIISAGRLVQWKGFAEIIDAMPQIHREITSARLYIIGFGPEEGMLRNKIRGNNLESVITMTGGVAQSTLLEYLCAGDIFILNSRYEGFSHTLLEAMTMEIPVMAYAAGGNSEIITDGTNGVLYRRPDSQAITEEVLRLYRHPELGARYTKAAKDGLQRFSKEKMLDKTLAIISAV